MSLAPLSNSPRDIAETHERLALLDSAQRAAVAGYLAYLADEWEMTGAGEVLREWGGSRPSGAE